MKASRKRKQTLPTTTRADATEITPSKRKPKRGTAKPLRVISTDADNFVSSPTVVETVGSRVGLRSVQEQRHTSLILDSSTEASLVDGETSSGSDF